MDNNRGKALGYRKAISMLKSVKFPITDIKQINQVNYIGDGIKKKIEEFLLTGHMKKIDFLKNDEKIKSLEDIGSVWGIGPSNAQKLFNLGIRKFEDLRSEKGMKYLTSLQKLGLKYHEDII